MTRTIRILIAAGLMLGTGLSSALATTANAIATELWSRNAPNNQRVQGAALSADGGIAYVASTHNSSTATTAKVWRSTDGGHTFEVAGDIPAGSWQSVATDSLGETVAAVGIVSDATVVYVSTDSGATWVNRTPSGSPTVNTNSSAIIAITPDGSTIALATTSAGVLTSTDDGASWSSSAISTNSIGVAAGTDGSGIVLHALTGNGVISWRTGDASATTHSIGSSNVSIDSSDDGAVMIVTGYTNPVESYISTDGGSTWNTTAHADIPHNNWVRGAVSGDGSRFAVSTYNGKLAESTDDGSTWALGASTGFTFFTTVSLAYDSSGQTLIIGTENSSGPSVALREPVPPPSITSVDPAEASAGGGTQITITGTSFYDVTSITVGGAEATSISTTGTTSITAVAPAGDVGSADVIVTTAHGSDTLEDGIEFYAPQAPTVTDQDADSGTFLGNDSVTFTGAGLAEVTDVLIGAEPATIVSRSRLELTIETPPNRVGLMDITITNPSGELVVDDAWTSTWEARSLAPEWTAVDVDLVPVFDEIPFSTWSILDVGDDLTYFGGSYFDLDFGFVANYPGVRNGSEVSLLGDIDPLGGLVDTEDSYSLRFGISTLAIDGNGRLWAGGGYEIDGDSTSLAVFDPGTDEWAIPEDVPDRMVLSLLTTSSGDIIAGGAFTDVAGDNAADLIVRIDPETFAMSPIGSDGEGGAALSDDGAFDDDRAVMSVVERSNGEILAGGTFTLFDSTSTFGDAVAAWNGTAWRSVVAAAPDELVVDMAVGEIDGQEIVAIASCIDDTVGRVSLLDSTDETEVIAITNGCLTDVEIVDGVVLAAGGFRAEWTSSTELTGGLMAYRDGRWIDLGGEDTWWPFTLDVTDNNTLLVGGLYIDGFAESTPIDRLLGLVPNEVTVSDASGASSESGLNVTVTGTGFDDDCEVTIDGRPVDDLEIVSATRLTFSTSTSDQDRSVKIHGWLNAETVTLSAPEAPTSDTSPLSTTTTAPPSTTTTPTATSTTTTTAMGAPTTVATTAATTTTTLGVSRLPSLGEIDALPIADDLIPAGTQLVAGGEVTVSASGFEPGEEITIVIASTPQVLGTTSADNNGTVSSAVSIPVDLVGDHTLVVWSPTTGRGVRLPVTITGATLPATGSGSLYPAIIVIITIGSLLALTSRRRRDLAV